MNRLYAKRLSLHNQGLAQDQVGANPAATQSRTRPVISAVSSAGIVTNTTSAFVSGTWPARIAWAAVVIPDPVDWRNTSVRRATGIWPDVTQSARTCPGPTEGSWSFAIGETMAELWLCHGFLMALLWLSYG